MTEAVTPRLNLLASPAGRRVLFALLYLSEGAPIGFVWWALPALLRGRGIELDAITTLTTIATLPWILKFLLAPVIDATLHRGVSVKRWILVCQVAMSLALLPLLAIDWSAQFTLVIAIVGMHAIFAAVQDVGIDTLAIHSVPRDELGRINGWMQAGMLGGRASVAAGSTLIAASFGDPRLAVAFLAALIAMPAFVLAFAVSEPKSSEPPVRPRAVIKAITTRTAVAGLAVALFVGAGFEFFGVSAGPRLLDLGNSESFVAMFFGFFAPVGLAAGALIGGTLTDRIGPVRGTALGLAVLSLILIVIALDDLAPRREEAPHAWFVGAYFAIGALTACSYALFMTLSRGEFAATRFSFFMAMTNACEAWSGFVGGVFASGGYGSTLMALTAASGIALLPLALLWWNGIDRSFDEQERTPA
jgi:MFS family permease